MSLFGSGGRKDEGAPAPDVRQHTQSESRASEERQAGRDRVHRDRGGESVASFGKSIVFKGDLTGDEDLEIEGRVEGQVKLPNHQLTIGAHGKVTAEVEAKTVIVVGHVSGNVSASERVEVQASGVVDGDIRAPRLLIQEGAVVNGSIQMGAPAKAGEKPVPSAASSNPEPARKIG